jgi:glycosyltransferase involved in cell wall biosynthesis
MSGRFCFILGWPIDQIGGVNEAVRNLIREAAADGQQPVLIESHGKEPAASYRPNLPARYVYYSLSGPWCEGDCLMGVKFLLGLPRKLLYFRRDLRPLGITVFNAHFPGMASWNFIIAAALGVVPAKVILSLHGSDIRGALKLRGIGRWFHRMLYRRAFAVVACSEGLRSELLMLDPALARNSLVIHNGIDIPTFMAPVDRETLPAELEGRPFLLHIGTFAYGKGQDLLLRAFAPIAREHPDLLLVLIGKPATISGLVRQMIAELGLRNQVLLFENVPHTRIPVFLVHTRLFVFSSRWVRGEYGEGFPLVILEAAAAGAPVVSTATSGIDEILVDGVNGRIVPLEDVAALAQAMRDCLADAEGTKRMAAALHATVRDRFTWRNAYQAYAKLAGLNG